MTISCDDDDDDVDDDDDAHPVLDVLSVRKSYHIFGPLSFSFFLSILLLVDLFFCITCNLYFLYRFRSLCIRHAHHLLFFFFFFPPSLF